MIKMHCSSSSRSNILAALGQPSTGSVVPIVLWETSEPDDDMINALGLGLKIHPRFFHALLAATGKLFTSHEEADRLEKRPFVPDLAVIENHVIKMTRHCLPGHCDGPPIILIAGEKFGASTSGRQVDEIQRFQCATLEDPSEPKIKPPSWTEEYLRVLQYNLEKRRASTGRHTDLLFRPLVPLLYFNIFKIREECGLVRERYYKFVVPRKKFLTSLGKADSLAWGTAKVAVEDLYEMRVVLRRMIEDSEDSSEQLQRFLLSQQTIDVPRKDVLTIIDNDLKQVRVEARRLETEIRDHLRLHTGEMALQESRKSIELSSLQIEEGKRGQLKCLEWWGPVADNSSENL